MFSATRHGHQRRRLRYEPLERRIVLSRGVQITEFVSSNAHGLNDSDGQASDWIEIYNDTNNAVDLAEGFYLTDDVDNTKRWKFPDVAASHLDPKQYLVVFASGRNEVDRDGQLHTNFKLSRSGEYLALVREAGDEINILSEYDYPEQRTDVAYGIPFANHPLVSDETSVLATVATEAVDLAYGRSWDGSDETTFQSAGGDKTWQRGTWGVGHRPQLPLTNYRELVTSEPSLISLYSFDHDRASEDGIRDVAGSGVNHGTPQGSIAFADGVDGAHGKSLSLTGDGYVKLGLVADFVFRDDSLTIEGWVRPTFTSGNSIKSWFGTRTQNRNGGSRSDRYSVHIDGDYQGVEFTSSNGNRKGDYALQPGEWTHLAVVIDGQDVKQYINGTLVDSRGIGGIGSNPTLTQTHIGTSGLASRNNHFIGQIDEVAIYEDVLSADTLRKHYETFAFARHSEFLNTDLGPQMIGDSASFYARSTFTIDDPTNVSAVTFSNRYTDGYAAYINGVPISVKNAPTLLSHQAISTNRRSALTQETRIISNDANLLRPGINVLSLQGLNPNPHEGGLLVMPTLTAHVLSSSTAFLDDPTPGKPNTSGFRGFAAEPSVDVERGVYDESMLVTVTAPQGLSLAYTTDGTAPSPEEGTIVHPNQGLAAAMIPVVSGVTMVRAVAFSEDLMPSSPVTHSYLVFDSLESAKSVGISRRSVIDAYGDVILGHLNEIPTVSLVVDQEQMFGRTGIHSLTNRHGRDVEIPVSMEYMDPREGKNFQVDGGIRLHGNGARGLSKKQFRLFLRPEYGDEQINFPIFDDSSVDEFSTLILRPGAHDSWSFSRFGTLLRDPFLRQTQLDMGQVSPRSRYVHLYINGDYRGVYYPTERPDADFGVSHWGGQREDWDSLNSGREITDGNFDRWKQVTDIVQSGPVTDESYATIESLVDIDSQLDDLMLRVWSGDEDWGGIRNYYVLGDRNHGKLRFVVWDAEIAMGFDLSAVRTPVDLNKLSQGRLPVAKSPTSQGGLFWWLAEHPEYQLRFADRLQRNFFGHGAMSTEHMTRRWEHLANQLDGPIIVEAAARSSRTRITTWRNEVDWVKDNWIRLRRELVIEDFREIGLYPTITAPQFHLNESLSYGETSASSDLVTISSPDSATIYYTLDGSDPRMPGGDVHPSSLVMDVTDSLPVQAGLSLRARAFEDGKWSALSVADFTVQLSPATAASLRITEVHYNPSRFGDDPDQFDKEEFEFIELMNISDVTIDLTNVRLKKIVLDDAEQGVDFNFGEGAIQTLAPGDRIVVVENLEAFVTRYGSDIPVAGQWIGRLGNGGETLTLTANGLVLQQFTYDDEWYPNTDGEGHSLVTFDPRDDLQKWDLQIGWMSSGFVAGSPGTGIGRPGDANADGRFDLEDLVLVFEAGEYEDDVLQNSTFAEGDWNNDGEFTSDDLVLAFTLGNYRVT